ncbi:MAG: radical SAM protein [Spirochaetia bacterium]|nr:radical SAM protein [Spirochaetia bacterium]
MQTSFSNYSDYYKNIFKRVYITQDAENYRATRNAISYLGHLPCSIIRSKDIIPPEHMNRDTLLITSPRGKTVGKCPGSKGHMCCNYLTADLYLGCTLGCSYCIMKSYLNFAPVTVYADPMPSIQQIKSIAAQNPDRTVRAGTGETGDSLQFDPMFRMSEIFVQELSSYPNIFFEMKTKTPFVDHLLDIKHKGNAVIGFSVNPPEIIQEQETDTFSLDMRLEAARKAVDAGFNVAFHFDPIIAVKDWENLYARTAARLLEFPKEKISWISLGTIRYSARLKEKMEEESPSGYVPYLLDEFVRCADNKYRYIQHERENILSFMRQQLSPLDCVPVYMCMESRTVWNNVFGAAPLKSKNNFSIFQHINGVRKHIRKN